MEVTERKENPLLDRVEIHFVWNHANSPTPSRTDIRAAAARAEPGAKEELVFVKDVNTRFEWLRLQEWHLSTGRQSLLNSNLSMSKPDIPQRVILHLQLLNPNPPRKRPQKKSLKRKSPREAMSDGRWAKS